MWRDRRRLLGTLDELFDYALRAFSADDVVRFLGLKHRPKSGQLETRHARRPEGRRIKHRIRQNWLKLYDKWSVLRIETVINNPADFRVLCFEPDRRGIQGRRRYRITLHSQGESLDELQRNLQEVVSMLLEDGEPRLESEFVGVQTIKVA